MYVKLKTHQYQVSENDFTIFDVRNYSRLPVENIFPISSLEMLLHPPFSVDSRTTRSLLFPRRASLAIRDASEWKGATGLWASRFFAPRREIGTRLILLFVGPLQNKTQHSVQLFFYSPYFKHKTAFQRVENFISLICFWEFFLREKFLTQCLITFLVTHILFRFTEYLY